jgi:hypothetical protein
MASATAVRSLAGSCVQTSGLLTVCMVGPPDYGYSLEGGNHFRNGSRCHDSGFGTWFW